MLPVPSVFIVGTDGVVDLVHTNPDYKVRLSSKKVLAAAEAALGRRNGFDLSNAVIPQEDILSGGPPRDGIPSIDQPKFIEPDGADYMKDDDEVISVTLGGETRAYPLRILVWHEVVNDELGGQPIAVTYCPLCGTAVVFSRTVGDRTLELGVSGLLFQSDVLLYDRQTESLWSQLEMASVAGPLVNSTLTWLPSQQLSWSAWLEKYPESKVLSTETGFGRNYLGNAYANYKQSPKARFPVPSARTELGEKEWIVGVIVGGVARAFSIEVLTEKRILRDGKVEVTYDPESQLAVAKHTESGEIIPILKAYWFAWQAFYPNTKLIR